MSEIIKSREHIKNSAGTYDTVYRETLAELVKGADGKTAQEHLDALIKSDDGAHGFRYNATNETFEVYNATSGEWEEVASGGGGGVAVGPVTELNVLEANGQLYFKWKDPENIVVDGVTIAEWAGTMLVRKAGSMPANRRDGILVVDNKTRDAYASAYFNDTGLSNGTVYYYKFFPYTTAKVYTDNPGNEVSATPHAVAPGNVSSKNVTTYNGRVVLKWTDPNNTVTDGITISAWAGSKVVYKAGSAPTGPDDGTLVLNSTTKNAYATNGLEITGLTNGTTYYFGIFPYATDATGGAVNTNASNVITGVPNRIKLSAVPSQSGSLTYNGSVQSPIWNNYNSEQLTIGGVYSSMNAGTYTATFTPKIDYCWSDGTTGTKNVSWSMGKAVGSLSISPTSVTLNKTTLTKAIAVTRSGDGAITATSSDTNVATVSVSGTTVTVSHVNQTSGVATITVKVAAGTNHTAPANKTCAVTATFTQIYGVQWEGTSATSMSRTDAAVGFSDPVPAVSNGSGNSPFDNLMPWSGITRITDAAAGELVAIPKFWYKWTKSGKTMKLQIADGPADGFSVSPAHANRGDGAGERDVVYVGRYHCASGYKSTTGVAQQVSITRSNARTGIHNLGSSIWQWDFAIHWTIAMLYLVEFADWNSQAKIGYGCSVSGSKVNNGQTDAMKYHTGTTAANRTTYGFTQYRNIEGLWDNVYDWMDGCYYNGSGLNVIINPTKFSDSANGTAVGVPTGGYPSELTIPTASGLEWALFPSVSSGSDSTYVPDNWDFNSSYPCLFVGGNYNQSQNHGLFCVSYYDASNSSGNIGCRLMKLS